jgi:hypothetical protein
MFVKLPFRFRNGRIDLEQDIKISIDQFIELLVSSYCGSFIPDRNFGFIFKNFKFENFDDFTGTIMKVKGNTEGSYDINYTKKIIGSSNNANTFAFDLKKSIEKYEQRLKNVSVKMDYHKTNRLITMEVKGQLNIDKSANYNYKVSFHVW